LESVDGVCIFTDKTATRFLEAARPDVYPSGDYTIETLNQDERRAVEQAGAKFRSSQVLVNRQRNC
jgi:bifunctional ADP-heptose synthase (sugar kinase/adenylyltransferase)